MSTPSIEPCQTVLVVDDNLQNREVAEGHLLASGYRAVLADDGARALELFEESPPDLVLLDVLMPRMDGFETCRRLRALPAGARTPILFLTALGDLGTHKAALDSGADDFLTKPINRTELLIRVRSLLRIKRLSDELRQNYEVIRLQRDALLAAQHEKQELATLIVHDLKNPLSSILSNVQFMRESAAMPERERDSLNDVLRASRSMFRLIMNLLDLSRSEDGAMVPRCTEFDLAALIGEICSEMAHRFEDKKQTLRLGMAPALGELTADRDLLRRVVENLIDNACKYSPRAGTIRIDVAPLADATDQPGVELCVSDEGDGIAVADRERIFEKYVRLDERAQVNLRQSHGLGLVFCRRAVEIHGGSIWVEDNGRQGSCFRVRLPRHPRAPVGEETAAAEGDGGGRPPALASAEPPP